jgi:hypothetical protein
MSSTRPGRPARRAFARPLAAAVAAVLAAGLAGCSVNAGSAASNRFEAAMQGLDGVMLADGQLTNPLPFWGSGTLVVWLDPDADRDALVAAVDRAMRFDPGANVAVDAVLVGVGHGSFSEVTQRYDDSIDIEFARGSDADRVVDLLLELDRLPEVDSLHLDRWGTTLYLGEDADPCLTVAAVAEQLGSGPEQQFTVYDAEGEVEEVGEGCMLIGGFR